MKKIKGILKSYSSTVYSNDLGKDYSGYSLQIEGDDRSYMLNKNTKSGVFFEDNCNLFVGKEIEFSCDTYNYGVRFLKSFTNKY